MGLQRSENFPRTFGPYLLLSSLGRGGMGEVFLAKKRAIGDIDRLCIVKTLRGDLAEHGEYVRRFMDEARVVVQLNHSNICQVYDATQVGTDFALEMEYIPGVNVKDLAADAARANAKIEPGLALFIGEQVCEALAYAHRFKSQTTGEHLKVIHRDVSPANVMVSFEGEVKLIDFGLAESTLKTEQTETRLVMGKVAYMAPEQARGDDIDGSVDQFAAAIVVYEALTGDRYYGDMNTHQVWQIVGIGGHIPRMWRGLDADAQAVIGKATHADPKQRYPSCDAFRDALEELRAAKYPRAGRSQLRELMHRLYGDRRDAEADLIASYADLRAPAANAAAELAESATQKQARAPAPSPSWENATDPWKNSPSGPSRSALPAVAPPGAPVPQLTTSSPAALAPPAGASSSQPHVKLLATSGASSKAMPSPRPADETPLSGAVDVSPADKSGSSRASNSASVAIVPPKNSAGRFLAASAAAIVIAVVAVLAWQKLHADAVTANVAVDAGSAPVVARVVDAGSAPVLAKVVDAGGAPAAIVDAGSEPAVVALEKPHADVSPKKHPGTATRHDDKKLDEKSAAKPEPPKVETKEQPELVITKKPDPPPPPPAKKAEWTTAQMKLVIQKCLGKQICAGTAQDVAKLLDDPDKRKRENAHTLVQNCVDDCVDKSGIKP